MSQEEDYLNRAVEMLDPELRPIPPQPNCPQSVQIYNDHRLMAADYFDVRREMDDLSRYKEELKRRLAETNAEDSPVSTQREQQQQQIQNEDPEQLANFVRMQQEKVGFCYISTDKRGQKRRKGEKLSFFAPLCTLTPL